MSHQSHTIFESIFFEDKMRCIPSNRFSSSDRNKAFKTKVHDSSFMLKSPNSPIDTAPTLAPTSTDSIEDISINRIYDRPLAFEGDYISDIADTSFEDSEDDDFPSTAVSNVFRNRILEDNFCDNETFPSLKRANLVLEDDREEDDHGLRSCAAIKRSRLHYNAIECEDRRDLPDFYEESPTDDTLSEAEELNTKSTCVQTDCIPLTKPGPSIPKAIHVRRVSW